MCVWNRTGLNKGARGRVWNLPGLPITAQRRNTQAFDPKGAMMRAACDTVFLISCLLLLPAPFCLSVTRTESAITSPGVCDDADSCRYCVNNTTPGMRCQSPFDWGGVTSFWVVDIFNFYLFRTCTLRLEWNVKTWTQTKAEFSFPHSPLCVTAGLFIDKCLVLTQERS